MKNILSLLIIGFFFVGCTQKTIVITPKKTNKPKIVKEEKILQSYDELVGEIVKPVIEKPQVVEEDAYNRIALIYPSQVVGPYAKSTISTLTSYLIFTKKPFIFETFDTIDENPNNINFQLEKIKEKGFKKVISLNTQIGFNILNQATELDDMKIYFSLINKNEIETDNENFSFGGISYDKQLELLHSLSSENNSMFYVESYIGNKLRDSYISIFGLNTNIKKIERSNNQYKYIMDDERLKGSTVMLNTPIIKSSIIMSQLTAYEIEPINILSTQLNYDPLLIKLTQDIDRTNFFVVNSIAESDSFIEEYTSLLGADIVYNWVDYSSLVGVNYFLNNDPEIVKTEVIDNQAQYQLVLYKSTAYGFEKIELN
ncbi:MAG: hypothetical protein ACNI25_09585 [Halarcobacter sp.]